MSIPQFPEDSWVQVRFPLTSEQEHGDRSAWPWLSGWVAAECGPDEWEICVEAPELAMEHEGDIVYPTCFRDSSELRCPEPQAAPEPKPGIHATPENVKAMAEPYLPDGSPNPYLLLDPVAADKWLREREPEAGQ